MIPQHGNYKRVTHQEVMEDAKKRDYTIVTVDSRIYRGSGEGMVVEHIVAPDDFYQMDEPIGYCVELCRPRWLYGSEGLLRKLEFIGRLEDSWLDLYKQGIITDDNDPFPECGDFIWAMPNSYWNGTERVSFPWKEVDWDFIKDKPNDS